MALKIKDLALVLNKNILILADFHIGLEEALNKEGVLIPRSQFRDIVDRLTRILGRTKFKKIIINGDLKHEFGTISKQEWNNTIKLFDLISRHTEEVVLVKGNHDTILGPIADRRKLKVVDEILIGKTLITHGHKISESENIKKADTIIIGHEHPSVSVTDNLRAEKFKCFLVGKYKSKKLVVMPSFNPLVEGTDVSKEEILSPYIKNVENFDVIIVTDEGKTYEFGKLKDLTNV